MSLPQDETLARLVAEAERLAGREPDQARALLREALARDPAHLGAHNLRERIDPLSSYRRWMRIECAIHPEDDIFRFFAADPGCRDPIRAYLADGWRSLVELMVPLERLGRPLLGLRSVLEFAAGFGRLSRHLAPLLGERLTAMELLPAALRFLEGTLGVRALPSSRDPAGLDPGGRYELVFALSFFTHLPPARWEAWLAALGRALAADGVLLFTTHGEAAMAEYGLRSGEPFVFLASSESRALDPEDYGTTFARAEAVRALLDRAFPGARIEHLPRAFWLAQDAWIILPAGGACG
ncbi:MAG: class I SAM-dependent methyltransferase [Xanthomonadales bacterium]|nr:class I SAM-dependent methyltransferase [Xanthomonadales bacterium]